MTVLIDADTLCYAVPFGCQKKEEDGSVTLAEPWVMSSRLDQAVQGIVEGSRRKDYRLYLTGTGNFRHDVAKIKPYKANRTAAKPHYYDAARDRLIKLWGAYVVDGMEADDAVSIDARRIENAVVAHIDKDLNQIPGKHYNYKQKRRYTVSPDRANCWFWIQCLTGDVTDNIPSLWEAKGRKGTKWGPVRSKRLLLPLKPEKRKEVVREMYADDDLLTEVASLVYLLRKPDERFSLDLI